MKPEIYQFLLQTDELREEYGSDFYREMLSLEPDREAYTQIDKDIARTWYNFRDDTHREQLRRILIAYANSDPEVGYC